MDILILIMLGLLNIVIGAGLILIRDTIREGQEKIERRLRAVQNQIHGKDLKLYCNHEGMSDKYKELK